MRYSKQALDRIFDEEMRGDTSFTEKGGIFGTRYSQQQAKDIWNRGIMHGIEIGLRRSSIDAQNVELSSNVRDSRHAAFLQQYYALCDKYKCGIHFHPDHGVCVYSTQVSIVDNIWQTK